jgi:hypothetical protein
MARSTSKPAAVPLTERNYERLREIDRQYSDWNHTVNYGLDYPTARGTAGAAEDDTGVPYSVFTYAGKYGVSPTKWLTQSWFRKVANTRGPSSSKTARQSSTGAARRKWRGRLVVPNPACGGVKPVHLISDRAKRYRANHPDCRPVGPKQCQFCGSRRNVEVHHLNGNEDDGAPRNLAWACRACNTKIAVAHKRAGKGKRTRQFNPTPGKVPTYQQYKRAVSLHVRGEFDEGGAIIHATPPDVRSGYARMIAAEKRKRGTHRRSEVPF